MEQISNTPRLDNRIERLALQEEAAKCFADVYGLKYSKKGFNIGALYLGKGKHVDGDRCNAGYGYHGSTAFDHPKAFRVDGKPALVLTFSYQHTGIDEFYDKTCAILGVRWAELPENHNFYL